VNHKDLDDVVWSEIQEEDENIDYSTVGSGLVYTEFEIAGEQIVSDDTTE
jgi:hypothetical protein